MNTNKFSTIKETYGTETLKLIRSLETSYKAFGRYESHLRFSLQCKHTDIIPKSIQVKTGINSNEVRRIVHKTKKAILNIRITEIYQKKKKIQNKIHTKLEVLKEQISSETVIEVEKYLEERRTQSFESARENQKKKYMKLKNGKMNNESKRNKILYQSRNSRKEDESYVIIDEYKNIDNHRGAG